MLFKVCPTCSHNWKDRDTFLSDSTLFLHGYQPNFAVLTAGFFLFRHDVPGCGTSMAIEVAKFSDMYDGPIFKTRETGTDKCSTHCLHEDALDPCPEQCECAYVRDVLQTVKNWPKTDAA